MKKLLAVLFVAAVMAVGAFAEEVTFPTGSWVDENWNGEWVLGADGTIKLLDSVSGDLVFDFTDDKITDKKVTPGTDGVTLSFYCEETARAYSFKKGLNFDSNLTLLINPDWADTDYQTTIMFKK